MTSRAAGSTTARTGARARWRDAVGQRALERPVVGGGLLSGGLHGQRDPALQVLLEGEVVVGGEHGRADRRDARGRTRPGARSLSSSDCRRSYTRRVIAARSSRR